MINPFLRLNIREMDVRVKNRSGVSLPPVAKIINIIGMHKYWQVYLTK